MAQSVPTKVFSKLSPETAMLFAAFRCTHPPPTVPPFLFMQNLSPKNVAPSNIVMSSTDGYIQESVNFRVFHMPLSVHHFNLRTLELWISVKHPPTTNSATYTVLVLTNAGTFWPETTSLLHVWINYVLFHTLSSQDRTGWVRAFCPCLKSPSSS